MSKLEIIPAIMPNSYTDLEKKIEEVLGVACTIQIDIMDGKYTKGKTWPFNNLAGESWQGILSEEYGMPHWESVDYEIDLMVNDIPDHFADLVRIGPKRIVFHFPTGQNKINELKDFIKNLDNYYKYEIELGIAYEHYTNFDDILEIKDDIKFVQCMGIERVGVQGSNFDESVIDRIKKVKESLPDHEISIDGAVNKETILKLKNAGADRFVCGSYIFDNEFPSSKIHELENIIFG